MAVTSWLRDFKCSGSLMRRRVVQKYQNPTLNLIVFPQHFVSLLVEQQHNGSSFLLSIMVHLTLSLSPSLPSHSLQHPHTHPLPQDNKHDHRQSHRVLIGIVTRTHASHFVPLRHIIRWWCSWSVSSHFIIFIRSFDILYDIRLVLWFFRSSQSVRAFLDRIFSLEFVVRVRFIFWQPQFVGVEYLSIPRRIWCWKSQCMS